MTEKIYKLLKDSPAMRWTALVLLASAMFFAYHVRRHLITSTGHVARNKRQGSRQPTDLSGKVKPF